MIPAAILATIEGADVSWHPSLLAGLQAVDRADPAYLSALVQEDYLPTRGRLLAAFAQPIDSVRYVLVGEGPYPRADSATGVCFMDGAVDVLWSEKGLSKSVNRATSLRNFMKMLLVADGTLTPGHTSGEAMVVAGAQALQPGSNHIQTLPQLQQNLSRQGFLLLNAALVFRSHVPPVRDARAWMPFLETIFAALVDRPVPPTLVLWGKIAAQLDGLPGMDRFPQLVAEHPYNLSFIDNGSMQKLFGPMQLLRCSAPNPANR
ncbi:uracil-DNA glycosylase [Actimicrobium sp. CCI2.3]|uniref:uracil-DNA glycosylase family protein n=1 Tax=Actimicrobium sp. CCI2.3 TaxID=3048616 RepID=UPI002AB4E09A|nr:uracil-DNA glycosylase [Actimicrobium sp. CCI2.3]MDY7573093.1 uracil-DNA glycosylase [Actimicrobium sp. CCI2.3]MEB0020890.1 uracil-DNA glycosylase [Actimicrobium sp. CCI2.3]